MSNKKAGELIGQLSETLLNAIDGVEKERLELQQFVNNLVPGIKSGEITPDRIQILENGDIRILPPVPIVEQQTCVEPPGESDGLRQ